MKFILGKKVEMTQRFAADGAVTPVTAIQAGPCLITAVKTADRDGYAAVQIAYGHRRRLAKPVAGQVKDLKIQPQFLREFRVEDAGTLKRGDEITVAAFSAGDELAVTGVSKGKGFQGVVRRHGFKGSRATHGNKDQLRMPGSIGSTAPQRVWKGRRMGGHMGDEQVTVHNLTVVDVDLENNLLYVKGGVPGARNGLVLLSAEGEMKLEAPKAAEPVATPVAETTATPASTPAAPTDAAPVAEEKK